MAMSQVFKILGLPRVVSWEETGIKPAALRRTKEAISKAPENGKLVVSGVSSPVIQELYAQGRKIAAIDYVDIFNAKFTNEEINLPPTRVGQVTLIYNVGNEPAKNFEYSSKVLATLLSKYSATGLVVIETSLTPSNFNLQYSLNVKNKLVIPALEEILWT